MNSVLEVIYNRRSVRSFTDESIDKEVMDAILKAAIHAPSGKNLQTWHFSVLSNKEHILQLKKEIRSVLKRTKSGTLMGMNNPDKVVIVSNKKDNYNAIADGACAIENMLLAAYSLGVGGCWINGLRTIYDEPEIRELLSSFAVPEDHMIVGMVVLGYPSGEPKATERNEDVIHWV